MNKPFQAQRRKLITALGAGFGLALLPSLSRGDNDSDGDNDGAGSSSGTATGSTAPAAGSVNGRVVIVGGGMAGATLAKYLRLWGGSGVQVTLVEQAASYTSNIMSNLVLNNSRSVASLSYGYGSLVSRYGVVLKQAAAQAIDKGNRLLLLADGTALPYDRLVLAPGIQFDEAYGLSAADYDSRTPHAWQAGPQTQLLHDQIAAMGAGSTFVMTIPKAPYRCPPGPYERACVVADHLKSVHGSNVKVLVLDENTSIQAERHSFEYAFGTLHAGIIDYQPGVSAIAIDGQSRVVSYVSQLGDARSVAAAVVNPIPPQRARGSTAGGLLAAAGLNNSADGRWAVVDVRSYESTAAPGIHVLGDAASTGMPKAGHIANQEAKVCADALLRLLSGGSPDSNIVTNSACYSPVTRSTASWLTAVYQYDAASNSMKLAGANGSLNGGAAIEAASISSDNFKDMGVWFNTLMADSLA